MNAVCASAKEAVPNWKSVVRWFGMLREIFGTCSVHKVELLEEEVPVHYGLIRFSADYIAAKKGLFPNANSFVLGGCIVSPTHPKTRKAKYCPHCRAAESTWHETHPRR